MMTEGRKNESSNDHFNYYFIYNSFFEIKRLKKDSIHKMNRVKNKYRIRRRNT